MKKRQRKKEGKKLIKKESKRRALYWLSRLRTGTIGLCELTIDLVREDALRGKFSLADIGTSEEELSSFLRVPIKENDMNEQEVINLMKSSRSEAEWNANCYKVKKACGGYPPFWFSAIILSGIVTTTAASFGGSADIKVSAIR